MNYSRGFTASICFLSALLGAQTLLAADWPRFRGPNGAGVSEAHGLPIEFGPQKNVLWKADVLPGVSSPILVKDRIVVTATDGIKRLVICLDRRTGEELWRRQVDAAHTEHRHPMNDAASPSPLTDHKNLYAFFPDYGLVSYDLDGRDRWKLPLGPFESLHGICASPILAENEIVLLIDQARGSYVAAFNQEDGRQLWKTERPDAAGGYSTPVIYSAAGQASQVIVSSPRELVGYSSRTGEKLWWVDKMGHQPHASPIIDDDVVYVNSFGGEETWQDINAFGEYDKNHDGKVDAAEFPQSWGTISGSVLDSNGDGVLDWAEWKAFGERIRGGGHSALVAVHLGKKGNLTNSDVLWRFTKSLPSISSPLLYRNVLYLFKDGGIVTALNPATGEVVKQGRLPGATDSYFSSPVAAEDKIYAVSHEGKVAVIKAGAAWEVLAVNDLDDECFATPAIGDSCIYIRTRHSLFAFGTKDQAK
jgi:outer membrane protein assembly factor BamB